MNIAPPAQTEALQLAKSLLDEVFNSEVANALQVIIEYSVAEQLSKLNGSAAINSLNLSVATLKERHASRPKSHPFEPLTAAALGRALDISDETVRRREINGELFSIMRPARHRGREYPAFQAWEGIAGEPLALILKALQPENGAMAFSFFSAKTMDLEDCAPIEVLVGRQLVQRALPRGAKKLLRAPYRKRLAFVEGSAIAFRNETIG